MPFFEGTLYCDSNFQAPSGAAEFSPRREPWDLSAAPFPRPLPRRAGEGEKGVRAIFHPGLTPWAKFCRP